MSLGIRILLEALTRKRLARRCGVSMHRVPLICDKTRLRFRLRVRKRIHTIEGHGAACRRLDNRVAGRDRILQRLREEAMARAANHIEQDSATVERRAVMKASFRILFTDQPVETQ